MIKGIAHACYTVSDLARSEEFYCDKLGLKQAFDFINDDGKKFGVYVHVGERTFIELFEGTHEPYSGDRSYRHLCLEVDDIEKTVAELRERGLEVGEIKLGSDHSYQAWLHDPDGNPIELHHYTAESKQNVAW